MKLISYFNQYNIKLKTAIIGACIIGAILIIYAFFSVFYTSKQDLRKVKNGILDLTSYYAEYNIIVNSNKTRKLVLC